MNKAPVAEAVGGIFPRSRFSFLGGTDQIDPRVEVGDNLHFSAQCCGWQRIQPVELDQNLTSARGRNKRGNKEQKYTPRSSPARCVFLCAARPHLCEKSKARGSNHGPAFYQSRFGVAKAIFST